MVSEPGVHLAAARAPHAAPPRAVAPRRICRSSSRPKPGRARRAGGLGDVADAEDPSVVGVEVKTTASVVLALRIDRQAWAACSRRGARLNPPR